MRVGSNLLMLAAGINMSTNIGIILFTLVDFSKLKNLLSPFMSHWRHHESNLLLLNLDKNI